MKKKIVRILKIAAITMFAFLIFFNISVLIEDNGFAVKMVNSIFALPNPDDPPEGGGGGVGGNYPYGMVAKRFDIWYCYKIDYKTVTIAGLPISIYCIKEYLQGVTTRVCERVQGGDNSCAPGYWNWDPNPPCGSDYSYPPSGFAWC
jgi:hypothetical protein